MVQDLINAKAHCLARPQLTCFLEPAIFDRRMRCAHFWRQKQFRSCDIKSLDGSFFCKHYSPRISCQRRPLSMFSATVCYEIKGQDPSRIRRLSDFAEGISSLAPNPLQQAIWGGLHLEWPHLLLRLYRFISYTSTLNSTQMFAYFQLNIQQNQQRHIIRIILMIPIYAITSWLSYFYYHQGVYIELIRDCYEVILSISNISRPLYLLVFLFFCCSTLGILLLFKNVPLQRDGSQCILLFHYVA